MIFQNKQIIKTLKKDWNFSFWFLFFCKGQSESAEKGFRKNKKKPKIENKNNPFTPLKDF